MNVQGKIIAKTNKVLTEVQLEENSKKIKGIGLMKYTDSFCYKFHLLLTEIKEKRYAKMASIGVCLSCFLFIALIVAMFVYNREDDLVRLSKEMINQQMQDDTVKFKSVLSELPDTARYQRYLDTWEQPLSHYWGSQIFGESVTDPVRISGNNNVIKNSLNDAIEYNLNEAVLADKNHPTIAFFQFKNVVVKEYNGMVLFADIDFLASNISSNDAYKLLKK
jgi:hypothetical protein